jgi:hypothetical protein
MHRRFVWLVPICVAAGVGALLASGEPVRGDDENGPKTKTQATPARGATPKQSRFVSPGFSRNSQSNSKPAGTEETRPTARSQPSRTTQLSPRDVAQGERVNGNDRFRFVRAETVRDAKERERQWRALLAETRKLSDKELEERLNDAPSHINPEKGLVHAMVTVQNQRLRAETARATKERKAQWSALLNATRNLSDKELEKRLENAPENTIGEKAQLTALLTVRNERRSRAAHMPGSKIDEASKRVDERVGQITNTLNTLISKFGTTPEERLEIEARYERALRLQKQN